MAGMEKLVESFRELEDQLAVCIKCGMCQSVCPLFDRTRREADVARGKIALLDGLGKRLFEDPDGVEERLNRCLLCGSCAANCPSGVKVVEIFIKARAIFVEYRGLSPAKKIIFRKMLANPSALDSLTEWAGKFQGIFTKSDKNPQGTSCPRVISPLLGNRHIVPISTNPFRNRVNPVDIPAGRSGLRVAFFTGCIIDKFFPHIGDDVVDILKFHEVGVFIPKGQGCCGIPALASGDTESFEKLVKYHIDLFRHDKFDYLITACATCTSTIKKLWPSIYRGGASGTMEKIRALAQKTLDINMFLVNIVRLSEKTGNEKGEDETGEIVTYHDPCHLKKSLGVFREPREIIKVSGKRFVEMEGADRCCGMGGSFNLYHYDLSSAIGTVKSGNIAATGCTTVGTGCPACMLQLSDMLAKKNMAIKVRHPVEIYAEAIRSGAIIK